MKIYIINQRRVVEGYTTMYKTDTFTDKREALKYFRRKITGATIGYKDLTVVKEEKHFEMQMYRMHKSGRKHTDYYEIKLVKNYIPGVQRVKVEPGFDFLAKIDCRNQYDEGSGHFNRFGKVLDEVCMEFTPKYRHNTKLEKAMIRENKIPSKDLREAFGYIILKDGYEFLVSCFWDCEYHVHPYAYNIKEKRLVDVTTVCPKLKKTQFWKETPEGYTFR